MRSLAEALGELLEHRPHAHVVRSGVVVGERESEELVPERVLPPAVLMGEAGAAQAD